MHSMNGSTETSEVQEDPKLLQRRRILREYLRRDGTAFDRYFFKSREGSLWIRNKHHELIDETLQKVLDGEITRLIINISPGYTKTEKAVINFIARGLAINPKSKYIHASYSNDLALQNSTTIRDTVSMQEYQELFPMAIREDKSAKKSWFTEHGGGMLAVASGGAITGFRAGRMDADKFSGAFIIDDPIKPDDAYSQTKREKINNRFNNTFKSRLAVESVPMIVIMQRLHGDDLCGYLLKGGSGDKWHHLVIEALIEEDQAPYPKEYTHGMPIKHEYLPGALWPFKHSTEHLKVMKETDPYTFASQYAQRPAPQGGGMVQEAWWKFYAWHPENYNWEYPQKPITITHCYMYADTAMKTGQQHDYSVIQLWAFCPYNGAILLDMVRGKWEAPELEKQTLAFWNKHRMPTVENNRIIPREIKIEDKASGTGLIQSLKNKMGIYVSGVKKTRDKVSELNDAIPAIASGEVMIPIDAPFTSDFVAEFSAFTPQMSHAHDDIVDTAVMAIKDLLTRRNTLYDMMITGDKQ